VGFHGGKGVATTGGAFAVLAPFPTIIATVVFLAVFGTTRIVSMGSIAAASVLPIAVLVFELKSDQVSSTIIVFVTLVCGWVIFKHRANIARLRDGTEARVGDAASGESPAPPPREE
jgi:glycerol-3-phosphate acyltransferase PlsY